MGEITFDEIKKEAEDALTEALKDFISYETERHYANERGLLDDHITRLEELEKKKPESIKIFPGELTMRDIFLSFTVLLDLAKRTGNEKLIKDASNYVKGIYTKLLQEVIA